MNIISTFDALVISKCALLIVGCILIDEMSVLESYSFNKESLDIIGFTDLGRHTPANQTTKLGDHALVVMYQPLSSQWVQPIAAFLSKGAASSEVLYQIILESTVLLENSNFRVNAIISDGAQWNRGMWALFGVTEDKIHTDHITDSARKLWFVSDFPHLIKNLRNWVIHPENPVFEVRTRVLRSAHHF